MCSSSSSTLLLLVGMLPSLCCTESMKLCSQDDVSCSIKELSCCSPSPVRLAIISFPDWKQLFAKTLSIRPQLMHELNTTTLDNDDNEKRCSLQKIEARRSQLVDNMTQYCQHHTCQSDVTMTPVGHVTPAARTAPLDRYVLVIIIVAGVVLLAVVTVVVPVGVRYICHRRKRGQHQLHCKASPSDGGVESGTGNGKAAYDHRVLSETNSQQHLIPGDSICETPSPTSASSVIPFDDVTPPATTNGKPVCADVNSQEVVITPVIAQTPGDTDV